MRKSKVSVRGQTVVPQEIREQLGIKPNSELMWSITNGTIVVRPVPEDPIAASIGILKGAGPTSTDVIEERSRDLALEKRRVVPGMKKRGGHGRGG